MNRIRTRLATVVTSAALGAGALLAFGASPADAAVCSLQAQAPYKHVRITGQKMVYGHGVLTCGAGVYSGTTHAILQKWNGSSWDYYGYTVTDTSFSNGVEDALANEFLCSNYGWGGSGSGYFRTVAWGSYSDYSGSHSTGTAVSGYRYLDC